MWTTIAIIAILLIYFISVYNGLIARKNQVREAWATVDTQLKRRYDLIPNLIETVRGAAKHEKETMFEVINLRKGMPMAEKNEAYSKMTENLSKINVLAESYPDLKASENFNTLQQSISDVEEHLQAARRLYNANVSSYNQMIVSFPISMIASSKGLTKKDFFEAEEHKKEDVKVEF